ncbi:MAG: Gfo/Idh/MocA family oxidoreductase [Verrucomicrobiota bacterium]|jgi:predicted dehydrogenase
MNQPTKKSRRAGATRREFLKKTTLAAAAVATAQNLLKTPVYGQTQAPAPGRVVGANNRLVVGYIGVGLQGMLHVRGQKEHATETNIAQAAVCDLSSHRQAEARDAIGNCDVFKDYERLLERKDIDAVTISVVEHWHAKTAIAALQAGKHVYLEKPMTRYLGEAFELHDAVQRSGKVFQLGSQGCSGAKWQRAAGLIRDGKIGPVVLGQASYMRNNPKGEWNTDPFVPQSWATPADLDWPKWQQPVHDRTDFSPEAYFRWRKFYPYSAGLLGDLFPHLLHPLMLATGNPEFPTRVVCLGQTPVHTDRNTPGAAQRDCPEDTQMIAEFPSGLALMMISSTVQWYGLDPVIRGHKGTLLMAGNRIDLRPEKDFADDIDPLTLDGLTPSGDDIGVHEANWFDCIRSNSLPSANADLVLKGQTVISLAEMSNRLNITCLFDEKTRKITNGDGKEIPAITYGTLPRS